MASTIVTTSAQRCSDQFHEEPNNLEEKQVSIDPEVTIENRSEIICLQMFAEELDDEPSNLEQKQDSIHPGKVDTSWTMAYTQLTIYRLGVQFCSSWKKPIFGCRVFSAGYREYVAIHVNLVLDWKWFK